MLTGLQTIFVTLLIVLVVVGTLLTLTAWYVRRSVRRIRQEWAAAGLKLRRGPEVGNYRGIASQRGALRGNGALGLTAQDVRFVRLVPRREFVIPLDHITRVAIYRSWHGRYRAGSPVLAISYQDVAGLEGTHDDAIGISVDDVKGWGRQIAQAAGVSLEDMRT